MSDSNFTPDWNKLQALFAQQMRWSALLVTIKEIAEDNKALVRDLSSYDPTTTVPLLAGLLTLPEYQSNCIRLEILVALAVLYCKGRKRANVGQAVRWFFQIGRSKCVTGEDPAEDVFVTLVQDPTGNYNLLEGVWETAGFYTQRVLEVISTMPSEGALGQVKRSFRALLIVADMVCGKSGLSRYQFGSDEKHSALSPRTLPGRNTLISRVNISFEELEAVDISPADLAPFLFHPEMKAKLLADQVGGSHLDRYPLMIQSATHLTVALPTALSVAARDFVIAFVIENDLVEAFDANLALNYSTLFDGTPLLGGPMHAPILWKKTQDFQLASFAFEVDEGYFISSHLFLPTLNAHIDGGFKAPYRGTAELAKDLKSRVRNAVDQFSERPNFRGGMILLVGCGWGKGYSIETPKVDNPNWQIQSISAADLVRLSWLGDMSPSYLWRIQNGLDAATKAGVEIVNLNGILNLIGWVRHNNGHFVPHGQLTEGRVSPDQPLLLNPPLNLLRGVRAEADRGYDQHRAIDNTKTWHDVRHPSPSPYFDSESRRRVYGSMDDLSKGILTSVYEGTLNLWVSIRAPNISSTDTEYRLWEMANEWLHRIGDELDRRVGKLVETRCIKVVLVFRDVDSPTIGLEKPDPKDLVPLCMIEEGEEPNSCVAVFESGFLSGFRIAENVAERLFVRNLSRAFLRVLNGKVDDDEVDEIEKVVVENDEARSFHFFHAQEFADYVRDTLPKKLICIDEIDDAAAKLGLGWRVVDDIPGNQIKGRNACTRFLGKVVDVLLSDVHSTLSSLDRISTLKRLVANWEKASAEEDHWKRTSAALLGLFGKDEHTINRCVEQISKFAGAGIASRVLTEMALCSCPVEGGQKLSDIQLSKLVSLTSLIVHVGGLSDAIHFNALRPELTISALGDILFKDDFGRLVVEPMLSRVMGEKFVAIAPLQKSNYDEPKASADSQNTEDDEFPRIWKLEMGFSLSEVSEILGSLEGVGIEKHQAIFEMTTSGYFSLMESNGIRAAAAAKFLEQFSLVSRSRWDRPPKGFGTKDIYPWRYGRRLSFVTRPILAMDTGADPTLIIAPTSLRKSISYVVDGAYSGRLEQTFFRTKEMRDIWWGKAREGHSFNAEVVEMLSSAGWEVRGNMGMPEILNRKMDHDYGDVDALAWRSDRKEVLAIECKDLSLARNYSEIAALLTEYQGEEMDGKPDNLKRHLTRVALLEGNRDEIERLTHVTKPQIMSLLVCSGTVPMQYARIDALRGTRVVSLKDLLAL